MKKAKYYKPMLSSMYGVFGGCRGGGRIHAYAQRYGYDSLIIQGIRIKLRYPLGCPEIDDILRKIVDHRRYSSMYYFTNYFDLNAVTIYKSEGRRD
jgi:hypothetical protein